MWPSTYDRIWTTEISLPPQLLVIASIYTMDLGDLKRRIGIDRLCSNFAGMVWNKVGANRETIALRPLVESRSRLADTSHLPRYAAELKYADPNSLYRHLTESKENQVELKRDFRALLVDRSLSEPEVRLRILSAMLLLEPSNWDLLNVREEAISLLLRESMKTKLPSSLIPWLQYYVGLKVPLARSLEDMLPRQHDLATRRAIIQLWGCCMKTSPDRLLEQISYAPCFEIDAWLSSYRQVQVRT